MQAPYLEFDAHKAARIYRNFAQALRDNMAGINKAMEERREKGRARTAAQGFELAPGNHFTRSKAIIWACEVCARKAEPMAASMGRAWLSVRDVETLMQMENGQALDRLLQHGDLYRALGMDRQKF